MAYPSLIRISRLFVAFLLLATHVLAVSTVVGIDVGTEYIKAALVKPGTPIDIILTKDSRRKELATVAFKPPSGPPRENVFPERIYGSDAAALSARFPGDVYPNLKRLLGLPVDDAVVIEYATRHPTLKIEKAAPAKRGTAAFRSGSFPPKEEAWMVEELLAMQLQSMQKNAVVAAGYQVKSAVITVPPFYTMEEKRAVQLAAELAGLRVLSLISDGLAVGLHYSTTRQFPSVSEGGKPEYHMVFDMGAGSTKATVLRFQGRTVKDVGRFNKTVQEVQIVGAAWDRTLGGDFFNTLIVDDMVEQFAGSSPAKQIAASVDNVRAHGRAVAKLTKEAERLRQILSANSNTQTSMESLYEDVNFRYKLSRTDFEAMVKPHAAKVGAVVHDALTAAGLDVADLSSVILHGGASRTPFVQRQLEEAIGSADRIRTNVNSDEAAVLGAGFRAAGLSSSFRVKDIRPLEGSGYQLGMRWTTSGNKVQHQRLWSAISPLGGAVKEVSFSNLDDFVVTFYQQIGEEERDTTTLAMRNLTATVAELRDSHKCAESDIRVKIGMKLTAENGEPVVVKAHAECEGEAKETLIDGVKNLFGFGKKDQPKDQQILTDDERTEDEQEANSSSSASQPEPSASSPSPSSGSDETSNESESDGERKTQIIAIPLDFTVEKVGIPILNKIELQKLKNRLKAFDDSDKSRLAREETLNQLEAFTYKVRDLVENDSFVDASTKQERQDLQAKAAAASDWLYDDGADATMEELKKRLDELKNIVDPIQKRVTEAEERPAMVVALKDALNQTKAFIEVLRKQTEEYDSWISSTASSSPSADASTSDGDFAGLEDDDAASRIPTPPLYERADLVELEKLYEVTRKWFVETQAQQEGLAATANPVLLTKDLKSKRDKLENVKLEMAMRGIQSFEKKAKKLSGEAARMKKTKSADGTSKASEAAEANNEKDGKAEKGKKASGDGKPGDDENVRLTDEELREILRNTLKDEERIQLEEEQLGGEDAEKRKPTVSEKVEL